MFRNFFFSKKKNKRKDQKISPLFTAEAAEAQCLGTKSESLRLGDGALTPIWESLDSCFLPPMASLPPSPVYLAREMPPRLFLCWCRPPWSSPTVGVRQTPVAGWGSSPKEGGWADTPRPPRPRLNCHESPCAHPMTSEAHLSQGEVHVDEDDRGVPSSPMTHLTASL